MRTTLRVDTIVVVVVVVVDIVATLGSKLGISTLL